MAGGTSAFVGQAEVRPFDLASVRIVSTVMDRPDA